jgi:parallel beta-helix repeat protein
MFALLAPNVLPRSMQSVNSEPVFIKADGTIFPASAPIQRIGNEYHVVSDVNCSSDGIIVEADNIILDGGNFVLQGYGTNTTGIDLSRRANITVRNFEIRGFYHGILMNSSMVIGILNNTLTSFNTYAVRVTNSSGVLISNNRINQFIWNGVEFNQTLRSTFSGNEVGNPSKISRNYAFWQQDSANNVIVANNITDNDYGIYMYNSNEITIAGNFIANNQYDLKMDKSFNNRIERNNITVLRYSAIGIQLYLSFNNTIMENIIEKCYSGLYLYSSSNNTIYQNNFLNNVASQALNVNSSNYWNISLPSLGNYWSDYVGVDSNHDGVGDTSYIIDANNTDCYPRMSQYIIPEFTSILILSIFMMATLLAVTIHRRRKPKTI